MSDFKEASKCNLQLPIRERGKNIWRTGRTSRPHNRTHVYLLPTCNSSVWDFILLLLARVGLVQIRPIRTLNPPDNMDWLRNGTMNHLDQWDSIQGLLWNIAKTVSFWWTWKCEMWAWNCQGLYVQRALPEDITNEKQRWRERWSEREWRRMRERDRRELQQEWEQGKEESERRGPWIQPLLIYSWTFQLWELVNPFLAWICCCHLQPLESWTISCPSSR